MRQPSSLLVKTAARARRHRPAVQVGAHRARQHHPRPVVAGEGDRPLDRPGAEHRPPRRDAPEALQRRALGPQADMLGHPLERAVGAAVVGAGHGGARHQPHVRQRRELGRRRRRPVGARPPADLQPLGVQPPAQAGSPRRPGSPAPRPARRSAPPSAPPARRRSPAGRRRRRPSRSASGSGAPDSAPEPGRAADQRLVDPLPERRRPHEGLVVEPRAEQRREQVVRPPSGRSRSARPAVLAEGDQPVVDLLHRRPRVRRRRRARARR